MHSAGWAHERECSQIAVQLASKLRPVVVGPLALGAAAVRDGGAGGEPLADASAPASLSHGAAVR